MSLDSVTSYSEARCPSLVEYEGKIIPKYHLTSKSPSWDPSTSLSSSQEDDIVNYMGQLITKCLRDPQGPDMTFSSVVSMAFTVIDVNDDDNFAAALKLHVIVDWKMVVQMAHLTTSQQKLAVESNTHAWCWGIPFHKAKRTVQCTT